MTTATHPNWIIPNVIAAGDVIAITGHEWWATTRQIVADIEAGTPHLVFEPQTIRTPGALHAIAIDLRRGHRNASHLVITPEADWFTTTTGGDGDAVRLITQTYGVVAIIAKPTLPSDVLRLADLGFSDGFAFTRGPRRAEVTAETVRAAFGGDT